jgi:protein-tyrosine phosphatase
VIDLHFVAPGLAVGAAYPMDAVARLAAEHEIARVVDLRVEQCDDEELLRVHGIRLLHLPTGDTRAISQRMLRDGVEFVGDGLDAGERVFVHCQYGIGRSALLALATLVWRGEGPLEALERVKRARPAISPSPEQLEALRVYAERVKAERGTRWEVPTIRALGMIAWRHLGAGAGSPGDEEATAGSTRRS